jgi:hypothetical protein
MPYPASHDKSQLSNPASSIEAVQASARGNHRTLAWLAQMMTAAAARPASPGWLAGIGETVLLYQGDRGRPRAHRMLTETTPVQDKLTGIFGLARYAPRR